MMPGKWYVFFYLFYWMGFTPALGVRGHSTPELYNVIRITARCWKLGYCWQDPLAVEVDLNAVNVLSVTVWYCRKIINTCQVVNFTLMLRVNLLLDSSHVFTIPDVTKRDPTNKESYIVFQALSGLLISVRTWLLLNPEPSLGNLAYLDTAWSGT